MKRLMVWIIAAMFLMTGTAFAQEKKAAEAKEPAAKEEVKKEKKAKKTKKAKKAKKEKKEEAPAEKPAK